MAETKRSNPGLIDLTGKSFGRLTVVRRAENDNQGQAQWLCECNCGASIVSRGHDLRCGNTRSCGCLRRETGRRIGTRTGPRNGHANRTHGHTINGRTRTYTCWKSMRARCKYPSASSYRYYGGRGITVCDPWLNSFEAFLADMGECPKGMSIDRINPNGNYEPGNCRWATPLQQRHNRRDTA